MIDVQRDLVSGGTGRLHDWANGMARGVVAASDWARAQRIPIVWVRVERKADGGDLPTSITDASLRSQPRNKPTRLIKGTPGSALMEQCVVLPDDYEVVKTRVNAFYGTPLEIYLRKLNVSTIMIGGVYTNMGVEATVRAAYDRDLNVIVLADACAAPSRQAHEYCIETTFPSLARVRTVAEVSHLVNDE